MLEYDNSAFYYFAITLLTIYIIPGTWFAVAEFVRAFFVRVDLQARSKEEKEKANQLKKQLTGFARLRTSTYLTNLACLIVAWSLLLFLIRLVSNDGEVSSFDPFQILGIPQDAPVSVIKKAYRTMSLKYHPDKNIGDKNAEEMFMKIAKAYEALTDETSKQNYEKYGNPDGKQALEVSIGLPKLLLDNPRTVLILYLIAMVVVIPAGVGYWYANSKQFGEKNIMYDTYSAFYSLLQDSHRTKNLVEILAASAEYRQINSSFVDSATRKTVSAPDSAAQEQIDQLYEKLKSNKRMVKPKFDVPVILTGNVLLHGHLHRLVASSASSKAVADKNHVPLSADLQQHLQQMLRRAPELLEGLIEIAHLRKWLEVALSTVHLRQCLAQALSWDSDPFLQLPHIQAAPASGISLPEFLRLSSEEQVKQLGLAKGSEVAGEVVAVAQALPQLEVTTELFVEEDDDEEDEEDTSDNKKKQSDEDADEDKAEDVLAVAGKRQPLGTEIFEQDLITLRVTLTRRNLLSDAQAQQPQKKSSKKDKKKQQKQPQAGSVYAPHFPATLAESWYLVLSEPLPVSTPNASLALLLAEGGKQSASAAPKEKVIHAFEHVTSQDAVVTHEVRFLAPQRAGHYHVELRVLSNAYLGLDVTRLIEFNVRPAEELPEYKPHEDDIALDNEPTLFEQMAAGGVDDEDSSSDEEEDDEDDRAKVAAAKKKLTGSSPSAAATAPSSSSSAAAASAKKPAAAAAKPQPQQQQKQTKQSPAKTGKKAAVKVEDVNSDDDD